MSYIIGGGGKLSGGKTVTFVKYCIDMHNKHGYKIITNAKLKNIDYQYFKSDDLINFIMSNMDNDKVLLDMFYRSILFIDEARNLFSARKSMSNLNEMLTQFIMMLGKLSCHFLYTYQAWTSMIDLQLREITHLLLDMQRVDMNKQPLQGDRILKQDILIKVSIQKIVKDKIINTGKFYYFDPKPYFKYYNTREMILVDRTKYLKK